MILVYYPLALLLIYFSFRSLTGGIAYLRYFRSQLANPVSDFTPYVSIIAPCRGIDQGIEANLAALIEQDMPAYEVIFVVDDEADAAVEIIRKVTSDRSRKSVQTKLVIAPAAVGCSQKVENLREAVLNADDRSQVFVFVDSDTRPMRTWLRNIISPLRDDSVGAATGYRWFISEVPSFASELRSVWNASIASVLGPDTNSNFCWGGAMAIRRDVFDRLEMRDQWRGTLSDDLAMTRAVKAAKLPIVFVPQAMTASVENCTFAEMLEFTTRQIKITRVYAQPLWILSFVGSGLFSLVMIATALILCVWNTSTFAFWSAVTTLVLVSVFSIGKSLLRLLAVELVLVEHLVALRRQRWTQSTLWLLSAPVLLFNCSAALISRRMTWRGIRYELKSPTETVIISGN